MASGQTGIHGEAAQKPCGTGLKISTRLCDNPKPSHGGSNCEGSSSKHASCNTNPCKSRYF